MAAVEEVDSGMASLATSSKDLTPEKSNIPEIAEDSDDEVIITMQSILPTVECIEHTFFIVITFYCLSTYLYYYFVGLLFVSYNISYLKNTS
jgi:hypothetical protein